MSNKQVLTSIEAERSDHDRSDAQIVEQCLDGDQEAWGVLLNEYQRLIQCIPLKYGDSATMRQTFSKQFPWIFSPTFPNCVSPRLFAPG